MNSCAVRLSVIISAFGLIVMPSRGQDGAFFAFASLTPRKQVLLAYLVLNKSRVKGSIMSERSSEREGKSARARRSGAGVRGCNLEARRGEHQGKRPEDLKDCGGVGVNYRNGLWEGRRTGGRRTCRASKVGTCFRGLEGGRAWLSSTRNVAKVTEDLNF